MAVVAYSGGRLYCIRTKPQGRGAAGHPVAAVAYSYRYYRLYCICTKSLDRRGLGHPVAVFAYNGGRLHLY